MSERMTPKEGTPAMQQRTWMHSRKGWITGTVVSEDETWVHIRVAGDHRLTYMSVNRRHEVTEDGDVITVRKSLLREVNASVTPPGEERDQ